jgi:hypothetical protein
MEQRKGSSEKDCERSAAILTSDAATSPYEEGALATRLDLGHPNMSASDLAST